MTRHAVLWDLVGTLADTEPLHALAFDQAISEFGLTVPNGFHDSLLGVSDQETYDGLVREAGAQFNMDMWRTTKFKHFSARPDMVHLRPNVGTLPERLFAQNVPMAVVSNSTKDEVAFIVKACGLSKFVQYTISRADVTDGKPAPDGYLLAASKLKCAPSNCIVVEDSKIGSHAGINAGMSVIYHPQTDREDCPEGAHYIPPSEVLWPFLARRLDLV